MAENMKRITITHFVGGERIDYEAIQMGQGRAELRSPFGVKAIAGVNNASVWARKFSSEHVERLRPFAHLDKHLRMEKWHA